MRCEETVIRRDPYMNPPNTYSGQCTREAVDRWIGQPVCRQHKEMHDESLRRAKERQTRERNNIRIYAEFEERRAARCVEKTDGT